MGCFGFTILVCTWSMVLNGVIMEEGFAAQKQSQKQASTVVLARSAQHSSEQVRKSTRPRAKNNITSTGSKQHSKVFRSQAKETPVLSKMPRQKESRKANARKKIRSKAKVRPRTDLMYHGLLEDSRRYDPRPNYRTAGVQNPHARNLTQDHFQELDHNQDGKIDPIERALSRIDIDRDLHNRQP